MTKWRLNSLEFFNLSRENAGTTKQFKNVWKPIHWLLSKFEKNIFWHIFINSINKVTKWKLFFKTEVRSIMEMNFLELHHRNRLFGALNFCIYVLKQKHLVDSSKMFNCHNFQNFRCFDKNLYFHQKWMKDVHHTKNPYEIVYFVVFVFGYQFQYVKQFEHSLEKMLENSEYFSLSNCLQMPSRRKTVLYSK